MVRIDRRCVGSKIFDVKNTFKMKAKDRDFLAHCKRHGALYGYWPEVNELLHCRVNKILNSHFGFAIEEWNQKEFVVSSDNKWQVGEIKIKPAPERKWWEKMFLGNKLEEVEVSFSVEALAQQQVVNHLIAGNSSGQEIRRGHLRLVK